jgi:tetratricopeptide (TPR) repeat protein
MVSLVDSAGNLGSAPTSTVEPAGQNFFLEHVHLRWEGNFALALMLAKPCSDVLFGARDEKISWLTPEQCAEVVGFTPAGKSMTLMRMDELTRRPPFTGQRTYAEDRERLLEEISAANEEVSSPGVLEKALDSIERARLKDPENTFLPFHEAAIRMEVGDFSRALSLNQSLDALEPPSPERAVQRAYLLHELGRTSEAEKLLLQSAHSDPYYFQTYGVLGGLWLATEESTKSLTFFEKLASRMPQSRGARLTYARLLSANGNWEAAEEQWNEVLRYFPDNEGALEPLVYRYYDRGLEKEALELMLNAFAYNPRSFDNNARLVEIYQESKDIKNTVKYMRALAESGPVNTAFHLDLARNYVTLGRDNEADLELHRAYQKADDKSEPELMLEIKRLIER